MKLSEMNICLVDRAFPSIYDVYTNTIDASAKLDRLISQGETQYEIMTWAEFEQLQRDKYLTGVAHKIDKDKWWEMLEILPPLRWKMGGIIETFCMSEFMTGSFTEQYGKYGDKYISKMVDYNDPSTEITLEDFAKAV